MSDAQSDAQQPEAESAAKPARPGVALAPPSGRAHGEPHLVARVGPIDGLEDQIEVERQLQLANDHDGRRTVGDRDHVAADDLALHDEAARLQKALDRPVECRFHGPRIARTRAAFPAGPEPASRKRHGRFR